MTDVAFRSKAWNNTYCNGGNVLFYPHEEIVRFVNKYVRKRIGINEYLNVMNLSETEWKNIKSLDLGCGIGRHVKFLDEFGLNPYGIDLSEKAITTGKDWFHAIGLNHLSEKITIGSVTGLPYKDDSFSICVSHSVLDCMERDVAKKGIKELHRVLKRGALTYLDFRMNAENSDQDEVVRKGFNSGTVESFFTLNTIKEFLFGLFDLVEVKIVEWTDGSGKFLNRRAHVVIKAM